MEVMKRRDAVDAMQQADDEMMTGAERKKERQSF